MHAAILQAILTIWALVAIFGGAFQCHVPRTWDYRGDCFDIVTNHSRIATIFVLAYTDRFIDNGQAAWHTYFCISNIVTDALIVIQALHLISRIQASWKKKTVFAMIFLSRILCVPSYHSLAPMMVRVKGGKWTANDFCSGCIGSF